MDWNNPEEVRAYRREWKKKHKEKSAADCRKYYERHKDKEKARHALYHQEHREEVLLKMKARHAKNREKELADHKRYHDENIEKERQYRIAHTELLRRKTVEAKYGLTPKEHDALLIRQNNLCAFQHCSKTINLSSDIDHDYKTGKVRGILCRGHNVALGTFEKLNPECLIDAYQYIRGCPPL